MPDSALGPTKERMLSAAARLFARRGFHDVGITELAGELGMTGAALYRHFPNKAALLVALCDLVASRVIETGMRHIASGGDDHEVLAALIDGQLRIAIDDRDVLLTYLREMSTVPREDFRRLRRMQRIYLEEWVHLVLGLRPELPESDVRALVHATISVLHSAAHYESSLPTQRLTELLRAAAYRTLGLQPPPR